MKAEYRMTTKVRHEWVVRGPSINYVDVEQAIRAAIEHFRTSEAQRLRHPEVRVWDDSINVTPSDDDIIVWYEVGADDAPEMVPTMPMPATGVLS